ncbi:hypothetical protein AYO21_11028 [Fonsecaea monophora]|uniref:Uncharacterized protein n=1 Tax=Fonsecaea monophora TaxID=254056 RepID=A0A177ES37_9EURO|nr:hypothetical protein AYO21_11028 [Fonsecaea monophora]OAG34814.1 hypothetical protein AYO21_11028 [Fonsecaea monophora]
MSILDWLDDTKNPTLWIIAIYPLMIVLLGLVCQFRMTHLVESIPLAPDEEPKKTEESERPTPDDTSMEYDLISSTTADSSMKKAETAKPIGTTIKQPEPRVPSPSEEPSRHQNVKHKPTVSPHHHWEFVKGILLYCLQELLAHRVGVLVARQVQEKHRLLDILVGFLAMSVVTVMLLMSQAYVSNARFLTLRGYRTSQDVKFSSDRDGPLANFFAIAFLSLAVPWLRLLYGVFIWWSVRGKTGC